MDPELRKQILAALGKAHQAAIARGETPTAERDDAFVRAATLQATGTSSGMDQLIPATQDVTDQEGGLSGAAKYLGRAAMSPVTGLAHMVAHPLDTTMGIGNNFFNGLFSPVSGSNMAGQSIGSRGGTPIRPSGGTVTDQTPGAVSPQEATQGAASTVAIPLAFTGLPGMVAAGGLSNLQDPLFGAIGGLTGYGLAKGVGAAGRTAVNTASAAKAALQGSGITGGGRAMTALGGAAASEGGPAAWIQRAAEQRAAGRNPNLLDVSGDAGSQLATEAAARNPWLASTLAYLKGKRDTGIPQESFNTIQQAAQRAAPEMPASAAPAVGAAPSLASAVGGEPTFGVGKPAPSTTPEGQVPQIETAPPERATTWQQDVKALTAPKSFDPLAWMRQKMGSPHAPTRIAQIESEMKAVTDPQYAQLRAENPDLMQGPGGVTFDQAAAEPVVSGQGKPSANQKALTQALNNGWVPKSGSDVIPGTGGGATGFAALADWYQDLFGKKPNLSSGGDFNDWFRLKQGLDNEVGRLVRSGETLGKGYNWTAVKALRDAVDQELQTSVKGYAEVQKTYGAYKAAANEVQAGVDAWKAKDPQAFQAQLAASSHPDLFRQGAQSQWLQELQNSPSRTPAGIAKRIVNPTMTERAMLEQTFGSPAALPQLQSGIQSQMGIPSMTEGPTVTAAVKQWQDGVAQKIAHSEKMAEEINANDQLRSRQTEINARMEASKGMDPESTFDQGVKDWKSTGPGNGPVGTMSPAALYAYRQGMLKAFVDEAQGSLKDGAKIAEKFGNPDALTRAKLETAFGGKAPVDALLKRLQAQAREQGAIELPKATSGAMKTSGKASVSPSWMIKKSLWNSLMGSRDAATASAMRPMLFSQGTALDQLLQQLQQRTVPRPASTFSLNPGLLGGSLLNPQKP